MPFHKDFENLTSPSKFIGLVIGYMGIIFTSTDRLSVAWQSLLYFVGLCIIYFLVRWFFVYRKEDYQNERQHKPIAVYVPKEKKKEESLKYLKEYLKE